MLDIEKIKALALDGDLLAVQELITRLEAAEKDAAKLKVIEQAAVIEKLSNSIRFDSYNMSLAEWKSICEVVNIAKTDSKQVLADWMREQLGEPVCWMWKFDFDDGASFSTKEPTLSIKDGVNYQPLFKLPELLND